MLTLPIAISTAQRRKLLPKAAIWFISTVCLLREYVYDAWRNLIEKRSGLSKLQTFSYDCENRLVRAETLVNGKLHSTGSYCYDSLGRRIAKTSEINGQTEHKNFLWQGLRLLREETPGQSSLYIYEPGSYAPLARVD